MLSEQRTSKAKNMLGHRCGSAGFSHVVSIMLGMGGQRDQGQECTNASAAKQSALGPAPHLHSRPPAASPSLPVPSELVLLCLAQMLSHLLQAVLKAVSWLQRFAEEQKYSLCLLVQFHLPVLGSLNLETSQKMLVQKLCPA